MGQPMAEPKVRAGCVQAVLRRVGVYAQRPEPGVSRDEESAAVLAERAGYASPRSIYRIMAYEPDYMMSLDAADRLLLAAGGHLSVDCDEEDIR